MSGSLLKRFLSFALLTVCVSSVMPGLGRPTASEAKKIKVEVEIDDDDSNAAPKKKATPKAAPATFPVTFVNNSGNKVSVSLLYYDTGAKTWRCQGWWNVEPQKKRSIKLAHKTGANIYYYVERWGNGTALSPSGTSDGVNWNITKKAFSYLQGTKPKLVKPYKAHFVRCDTDDGWFQLTVN